MSNVIEAMALKPNHIVMEMIAKFDGRTDAFEVRHIGHEIDSAAKDQGKLAEDDRLAWWAEWAAFTFDVRERSDGGPWNTFFQPIGSWTWSDGTFGYRPNLDDANADVVVYWAERAKTARHPVLIARYADLVWDTSWFVTKRKPEIEFARLAIDNYIAASRIDDGAARSDTRFNLGRALKLAISVKDTTRTTEVVKATIEYVNRTADDDKIGTFCYLFDNLLSPDKGPELTEEQERNIISMFQSKFAEMAKPGGQWDGDPHSTQNIGIRLAMYYKRKGRLEDRVEVLRRVAQTFERRAKMGDALLGVIFLDKARDIYSDAGLKAEADRVQLESQKMHPEAAKEMAPVMVKTEVKQAEIDAFLAQLFEGGMENLLVRFVVEFVPDQTDLEKYIEERDMKFPTIAMFAPRLMDDTHLTADIGDDTADPDGRMVFETSRFCQFHAPWITWAIDHLIKNGLTAAQVVDFVGQSALFTDDRLPMIQRGVEAHIQGDHPQAIHFLIPQIERAIVNLLPHAGKPSNKQHRTGRGAMQFKNLNDVLTKGEWPVPGDVGENLRLYLLSVLAHPKGMNIRNDVCHGLWPADRFNKAASERVLHALLTVAMLRPNVVKVDEKPDAPPPA